MMKIMSAINKFTICEMLMLVAVALPSSAIVPFDEHDNISWKFYNDEIPKQVCYEVLDRIPLEYREGVRYIKVLPDNSAYLGLYWAYPKMIELFGNCDQKVIIHELAHHCQFKKGDTIKEGKNHIGHFDECEDEIWESIS